MTSSAMERRRLSVLNCSGTVKSEDADVILNEADVILLMVKTARKKTNSQMVRTMINASNSR